MAKYLSNKPHNQLIAIIETSDLIDCKRSHEITSMGQLLKLVERCMLFGIECHVLPIPKGQVIYKTEE